MPQMAPLNWVILLITSTVLVSFSSVLVWWTMPTNLSLPIPAHLPKSNIWIWSLSSS